MIDIKLKQDLQILKNVSAAFVGNLKDHQQIQTSLQNIESKLFPVKKTKQKEVERAK